MYRPVRDLLLITIEKDEDTQTDSGIFIPRDKWNTNKPIATVEAIGPHVDGFTVGDRVLINPYAVLDIAGEKVKLIKQKDIIAHVG